MLLLAQLSLTHRQAVRRVALVCLSAVHQPPVFTASATPCHAISCLQLGSGVSARAVALLRMSGGAGNSRKRQREAGATAQEPSFYAVAATGGDGSSATGRMHFRQAGGTEKSGVAASAAAKELAETVQTHLAAAACPKAKAWMENYVKRSQQRGNKAPACRQCLLNSLAALTSNCKDTPTAASTLAAAREGAGRVSVEVMADAACLLIQSPFADDKFTGILLLAEFVLVDKRALAGEAVVLDTGSFLGRIGVCYDLRFVDDWSTADWMSIKVLGPFIMTKSAGTERAHAARQLLAWSALPASSSSVWKRRAGHVTFVNYICHRGKSNTKGRADKGDALLYEGFLSDLISACQHALLCSSERFSNTGAGWVLRYTILVKREESIKCLETCASSLTKEGLNYALEKTSDAALKKRLHSLIK